jgi:hypothetical protein
LQPHFPDCRICSFYFFQKLVLLPKKWHHICAHPRIP